MNKHMIILPMLVVSATALLLFSLTLPEETVMANCPEPPCPSPVVTPEPGESSGIVPVDRSPSPGKPTPKPTPTATPTPLPDFGIAATTPDAVLREAKIQAGRVDPFMSIFPPDLPEFEPAIAPEQLALPSLPPLPVDDSDPGTGQPPIQREDPPAPITRDSDPPRPVLGDGLQLKGIMDGGVDPIAIIEVHGKTELVRVGERLSGGILVTSINFDERRVTLSRGSERTTLTIPEPTSQPF